MKGCFDASTSLHLSFQQEAWLIKRPSGELVVTVHLGADELPKNREERITINPIRWSVRGGFYFGGLKQ